VDWGDGGFGGAVGVGDVEGAVGFHDESDVGVVRGSVVVVFAEQAAVAGTVRSAVFSVLQVVAGRSGVVFCGSRASGSVDHGAATALNRASVTVAGISS
jgi:hypothetical protein